MCNFSCQYYLCLWNKLLNKINYYQCLQNCPGLTTYQQDCIKITLNTLNTKFNKVVEILTALGCPGFAAATPASTPETVVTTSKK